MSSTEDLPPIPTQLQTWAGQALNYQNQGRVSEARELYLAILSQRPDFSSVSFNLGLTYYPDRKLTGEAIRWFQQSLAYAPHHLKARMLLAECCYWNGEVDRSLRLILPTLPESDPAFFARWQPEEQAQLRQRAFMAESWLLKCLYALDAFHDQDFLRALRAWGRRYADPFTPSAPSVKSADMLPRAARPLRVGYLSQEFGGYSSGYLILPLLANHNPEAIASIAFSDAPADPHQSRQFKPHFQSWHEVYGLSVDALVEVIRSEKIDILVDLGGHTHPERLLVFARKPAPVQVTGLGFGTPVGLSAMDGFITDPIITPPTLQAELPEQIFYLDRALHWQPPPIPLPIRPRDPQAPFIFGSANGLYKLDLPCLRIWADILKACPSALLWLKAAPLAGEASVQRFKQLFQAAGVSPERLILQGITPPFEHLDQFYNGIDLALDPFPYNGGVTTCDALWMGVPVLSLNERNRCGASILSCLQLTEYLAESRRAYVQRAIEIYHSDRLSLSQRAGLRARLLASPLCDMKRYAEQVEAVYQTLWQRHTPPPQSP